jgi:hypothetical protein
MQDKLDKKSTKIANTTDNIDRNVNRVFDRFDKIEGAIKNSNPIANPKTANDYIVNAYIFKNAGEIEKSIEMFSKYLKKTKTVKFDIYNEYYQLLKLTFSQKYAEERTRSELNSEMISTVVFYNEIYGEDAIKEIAKLKISKTLKDFLFIVKSNEIKTNYISYLLYPFYLDVMHKRISLGKQFEKVYPFFFDTKGPLELLRLNNWGEIRGEIIMGHAGFQVAIKAHNSGMKELVNQEYEEWLLSAAKTSESTGGAGTSVGLNVSNTKAYIKYGTDVGLNRTFRSMP